MYRPTRPGLATTFFASLLGLTACGHDTTSTPAAESQIAAAKPGGGNGNGSGNATAPTLVAEPNVRAVHLNWNDDGTSQYNVYLSSSADCDLANYSLCPDGQMLAGVRSPQKIDGLDNGRVYYARVEKSSGGRKATSQSLVSNLAGARPTTLEFSGEVYSIAVAADGTKYLGGDFTRVGLTSGQAAALDVSTGKPSVPGFPYVAGGGVTAAAPDGSGGWYLGGDFRRLNGLDKPFLAHVRSDGSLDTAWNPLPSSSVNAIAVMNGIVYIGGNFTTINGQSRRGVAAIDAASGALTAWNPDPDSSVWTLVAANGTVYMGGTFTMMGAFRRGHLAAVDTNANVLPWDPGADGTVRALALAGSTVFVGGHFSNVGGQPRNRLAALDPTTGLAKAWNASLDCLGCEVRALAASGTNLYVGGRFPSLRGVARNHIAAVDVASGNVLAWNPNAEYAVNSLSVFRDSTRTTVYAGGEFVRIGGQPHAYLAAIDGQGAALPTWQPAPTSSVDLVAVAGNHVLAGGRFTGMNAVVRNRLAAIDATGALKAWNPNADGTVFAVAASGNAVYAGGRYGTVGGQPRANLARLDAATGAVDGWNPGTDRPVLALAIGSTGTVYAGGEFTAVAGQPRGRLAAFLPGGTLLDWRPNADRDVRAIVPGPWLQSGESVYVGGRFNAINSMTYRRIAQIDAQGWPTYWNPWGFEPAADHETVNALAWTHGTVYAGGLFARLGPNLAQISETGVLTPIKGTNLQVWALALAGNRLTVAGDFTLVLDPIGAPTARSRVATIDVGTRALTSFSPNIPEGTVFALGAEGTAMHLGGTFTQINGQIVSGFASLAP